MAACTCCSSTVDILVERKLQGITELPNELVEVIWLSLEPGRNCRSSGEVTDDAIYVGIRSGIKRPRPEMSDNRFRQAETGSCRNATQPISSTPTISKRGRHWPENNSLKDS